MPLHTDRRSRTTKPQTITRWIPRPLEQLEDRLTPASTLTNTPTWIDVGPHNISGGQISAVPSSPSNSSVSGAMQAIVADRTDLSGNTLYAGGVNGGIWKTTNALALSPTWTPLTDSFPSLSISSISINPDNNQQILAGIGGGSDGEYAIDPNTGVHTVLDSRGYARGDLTGALYSENGGTTWRVLSNSIAGQNVVGVAVRTNYMLVAGDNGVFRSTDGGRTFALVSAGLPAGGIFDLAADPGAPVVQVASATWNDGVATITTAGPHALSSNQSVIISGLTPSGYNGTYTITKIDATTFTYSLSVNPGNIVTGGTQDSPAIAITAASWVASVPVGSGTATITTATPNGLAVGESVTIAGVSRPGYNGTFVVTALVSPTQFSYTLATNPGGAGTGGLEFIVPNTITAAAWGNGVATITTAAANTVQVGEQVTIAGVSLPGYNGTFTVLSVNAMTREISYSLPDNPGDTTTGGTETNAPDAVLSATWFNGLATITTNGPNGIAVGQIVTVNVPTRPGFNGTFVVRSINVGTNQFTYALAADPGGAGTTGTATTAANPIRTATFAPGLPGNPGTVTITTTAAHGLTVGESVTIAGIQPSGYNGTFLVTSVISPTQFTYSLVGDPGVTTTSGSETANTNPNANPNTDQNARNRFYVAVRTSTGPIDPLTSSPGGRGVYLTDDGGVTWRDVTFARVGVPDSEIGATTTNVQIAVFNSGILTNNIVYVAVENNRPTNIGSAQQATTTGFDYAWQNRLSEVSTISWSANQGLDWTRMDAPRAKTDDARIAGIVNDAAGNVTVFTRERHQLRNFDEVQMAGVRSAFVPRNGATPPIYPALIGAINGARYVLVTGEFSFRLVNRDGTPNGYTGSFDGNANATWAQILGANAGERPEFFDLVADPTRSDIIYLGTDRSTPDFYNNLNNGPLTYTSTLWRGNRLADVTGSGNTALTSNQWTTLTNSGIANGSAPAADVRDLFITAAGRLTAATGGGIYVLPNAVAPSPDVVDAFWNPATTTATVFTSAPHGLLVGQSATLFGIASAIPIVGGANNGYNGIFTVTAAGTSSFSYMIAADPGEFIASDSVLGGLSTVQFNGPHGYTPGETVIIHSVLPTGYNGTFVVTSSPAGGSPAGVLSASDAIESATWLAGVATVTTTAPAFTNRPHGLRVGDIVFISGSGVGGYNGQYVVTSVPGPRQFTYDLPVATDPGASTGGLASPASANTLIRGSWVADVVTLETAGAHNFVVGEFVTVDSATGGFNGVRQITAITSATEFSYASVGFNPGTFVTGAGGVVGVTPTPHTITGATWTAGVARIRTAVAHRLRVGDTAILTGINPAGYNGTYTVTNVVSATQFEYASSLLVTPGTYGGGGVQNMGRAEIIDASGGTLTTAGNHYLQVGEAVVINGVPGYNGTFIVTSTPTNDTFTTNSGSTGFPSLSSRSLTYTLASNFANSTPNARAYATDRKWATLNGDLAVADVSSVAYDQLSNIFFAGTIDTQAITQNTTGSSLYSSFFGTTSLQNDFHDQANVFKVLIDNIGLDNTGTATGQTVRYYVGSNFQNIIRQTVNAAGAVTSTNTLFFADELSQGAEFSGLNRDPLINRTQNVRIAMALGQLDPRRALFGYNGLYEDSDPSGDDDIGSIINDVTPDGMTGPVEQLLYGGMEGGRGLNQIVFMTTQTGQLFVRGEANDAPGVPFGNRTANLNAAFGAPVTNIFAVVADPDNYRHFYVAAGDAAGTGKIFESFDFGLTFTDISANLIGPATMLDGSAGPGKLTTEIRTLSIFDTNPGGTSPGELTLLAGGRGGVYRLSSSPDCADAPWSEFGQALPNTVVNDLQMYTSLGTTVGVVSATFAAGVGGAPGTVTITTAAASGVVVGQSVAIAGVTPNGYNGTFTVLSAAGNTFTYALATDPGASGTSGSATPTNQRLVAATAGRGIWQIADILGTVAKDSILTVTGSGAADTISISLNPNNPNEIQVFDSSAAPAQRIRNFTRGSFTQLRIDALGGADTIVIASNVDPITRMPLAGSVTSFVNFDIVVDAGGDAGDRLLIDSRGSTTSVQTTVTETTIGDGLNDTLFVGCGEVEYTGLDAGTIDITTGTGDDVFILTSLKPGSTTIRGGDGSEAYALAFDVDPLDTSALAIVDTGVVGTDSLTATGTVGNDAIGVSATGITLALQSIAYSGIEGLTVLGDDGDDTITATGYGGTATDTFDGGEGSDVVTLPMSTVAPALVTVADSGTGLAEIDRLFVRGTAGDDTFLLNPTQIVLGVNPPATPATQTLDYSGIENVALDALAGSDIYTVPMLASNATDYAVADTGATGIDTLNASGTAAVDTFAVSAAQIVIGTVPPGVPPVTQSLDYAGLENLSLASLGGADVITVTGVGATLDNLFNGGLLGDTYNVTMSGTGAPIRVLDSGGTPDVLNVFGTAGNDAFSVAPTQIVLGAQTLAYSAQIESLVVSGLGGADSVVLTTEAANSNVAFRFDGGIGADAFSVLGVGASESVAVDITSGLGNGFFSGLRQGAAFTGVESIGFNGGAGTNSFEWRERTGGKYGNAYTPETGVVYTPTGAASGIVRVGNGGAYPTVAFANVNGDFFASGDAGTTNRDSFTLLGVSTAGQGSGFGETTSSNGSDSIVVTDRFISISNAVLGTLRQVNFRYVGGLSSFDVIQVRGGNESVIGDQFVAYPTQYSNANILVNGMNPTSGSAADRLTVVSDGTTTRFQATGTVFGPPQTRVVQSNDGASLGYFNIETTNIFDLTAPPGSPPGTPGNGTTVPSNGYYTVTSDSGAPAQVLVYDRLTDALRFTLNPFDGFFGGVRAAVGDVTGDGTPDIVVAAGPGANPHVKVFDGVTGEEIRSFFAYGPFLGGVEVAVGDLDGDGYAEIITGSGPQTRAHIKVFDGVTFAERESYFTFNESPDGFLGGIRVAVGDINGDGVLDIAVAAQAGAQSRLTVYDGRNLKANDGSNFLLNYFAFGDPITGAGFTGGVFLAVGDVNGDGFADVIAGAGQGGEPAVRVTSGRTGGIIHSFNANDSAGDATSTVPFEGGVRVAAVDFDNDGLDDILTAKGPGTSPFLRFFRFGDLNPAKIIRVNTPVFNGNYAQGIYVGG